MPYKDIEKQREYQRRRTRRARQTISDLKSNVPCTDCRKTYPPYVMDWDHIGEKRFIISKAANSRKNREVIKEELSRCELVCSNCHRIRTQKRLEAQWNLLPTKNLLV